MKSILKNLVNAVLFRIIKLLVRTQLILQFNLGLIQTYAPNPFSSKKLKKNDKRESLKRFQAITKFLPKNKSLTTIDIGCNLGFFTFSMAKKYRGLSIGIDYGRNEILAAKALATKYSVDNILFIQREVTDKNAYLLPNRCCYMSFNLSSLDQETWPKKKLPDNGRINKFYQKIFNF